MSQANSSRTTNATLQAASISVLEGLGQLASYFGFSKVMGQLYGALLLSPDPLSLDDLMDRLGISKASVSTNMRTLEHMGIVREAWVRDDRRKYYRAESDFWRIVSNVLASRELRDVNRAINVLSENNAQVRAALPSMSEQDRVLAEHICTQLQQLEEFFRLAQLILNALIQQAKDEPPVSQITRIELE